MLPINLTEITKGASDVIKVKLSASSNKSNKLLSGTEEK